MFLLTFVCQPTKRQGLTHNFHSIWFLYFVNAFQSTVFYSLSPYISSSFQAHSLSGVPMALADAFTAACYLPVGKLMDTWGRAQGFLLMTVCATLGLILFASCNSFAIYCVGYVRWPARDSTAKFYDTDYRCRSSISLASVEWSIPSMSLRPIPLP
jgi:MFS family permease